MNHTKRFSSSIQVLHMEITWYVTHPPLPCVLISKPAPLEQPCEVKENTGSEVEVWLPSLTEAILDSLTDLNTKGILCS